MKAILIILIFLILGSLIIINNHDIQITKKQDLKKFSEFSLNWIDKVYSNIQNITGHVIKESWLPE